MERDLSAAEARTLRLRSQRLHPATSATTVEDAVAGVCGIQAQDERAGALAVRARSCDTTASSVTDALFEDRSIVRTWCMRGTLHLLATADVPWLLSVFGPVFVARSRRRLSDLGFDDDACERAMAEIEASLAERGPLTRAEIATSLQDAGLDVDPDSQAPYHLVRRAALLGIVCEVAPRDGEEAYDLLSEWVSLDDPPDRETALGELARRYLAAYQPATIEDFASWSKLPMRDVRRAWESVDDEVTTVGVDGHGAAVLTDDVPGEIAPDAGVLRLLPAYDTYVIGYEGRGHAVPAAYDSRVWPGGGIIRPVVTLDGLAIATWKFDRSREPPTVVIDPFDGLDPDLEPSLRTEIDDVGRFLGSNVEWRLPGG